MSWNEERAKVVLARELERRVSGPGTSESTLARLSALADPAASSSLSAFERALVRAGSSAKRIAELRREVRAGSWMRRAARRFWSFLRRFDQPIFASFVFLSLVGGIALDETPLLFAALAFSVIAFALTNIEAPK